MSKLERWKQKVAEALFGLGTTSSRLELELEKAQQRDRMRQHLEDRERMARHLLLETPKDALEYGVREDWWKRCEADLRRAMSLRSQARDRQSAR